MRTLPTTSPNWKRQTPRSPALRSPDVCALRETLFRLKDKRDDVATAATLMTEMGIAHHVQGEADARLMKTAQGPTRVAYNVQSVVDAEHGLILHHEVTQEASDNR